MMFRALRSTVAPLRNVQQRSFSGIPTLLSKAVWKKSTIAYITYIVAGCVVLEAVYGNVTNYIWESYNYGKLYHQVDWSKFKSEDDEEEE